LDRTILFAINRERARDYFNIRDRIYCFDSYAQEPVAKQGLDTL